MYLSTGRTETKNYVELGNNTHIMKYWNYCYSYYIPAAYLYQGSVSIPHI